MAILQIWSPFHLFLLSHSPRRAVCDCLSVSVFSLLSGAGETTPCPEMKTQLAMMKKKPPLEKSRPDSAISSKMVLSVHHLTLQVRAGEPQCKVSTCKPKLISRQGWNSRLFLLSLPSYHSGPMPHRRAGLYVGESK